MINAPTLHTFFPDCTRLCVSRTWAETCH